MGTGAFIECKTEITDGIAAANQQRGVAPKVALKGLVRFGFMALTLDHETFEVL